MIASETLAGFGLFEGLSKDALSAIAALGHETSFPGDTFIFAMGQPADRIYFLLEGTVGLSIFPTSQDKPITTIVLKSSGQAFGWSAVLDSGYYTAAAQAMTDVRAVAVDGKSLMDYLTQNPAVGFVVMQRLAQVISHRLSAVRKLLLETIRDCVHMEQ